MRLRLWHLLILVEVTGTALFFAKAFWFPEESGYRHVEIIHRHAEGSIGVISICDFDLNSPPSEMQGKKDGLTRFRELIADLQARKAEYRVTCPRGFQSNGDPIL
jgi:hypothetical protein